MSWVLALLEQLSPARLYEAASLAFVLVMLATILLLHPDLCADAHIIVGSLRSLMGATRSSPWAGSAGGRRRPWRSSRCRSSWPFQGIARRRSPPAARPGNSASLSGAWLTNCCAKPP